MVNKFLYCDTETTGTDPAKHGLIQIAGIIVVDGKEVESFNLKLKPHKNDTIEVEALKVNGITADQLEAPDRLAASVGLAHFQRIMSKYVDKYNRKDKMVFCGYNARFDMDFIRALHEKEGDEYFGSWFWFPPVDVMNTAMLRFMHERDTFANFKLATVAERLGVKPEGNLHDALVDVRLTRKILQHLLIGPKP
jgi:DNA polymerase-3 subunit epsilon